jgi:SAM-dependent methyltransferase
MRNRLRREWFLVTPISMVINPLYIIRNGLLEAISKIAPTITGDVLDFGCGSKPYESLFTHATSYTGVDIEVSGHDHKNSKVDVFYDGKTLPFPEQSFDAAVCFEVLEHVFNLEEVLAEIRRVLRPNGHLLLSIPFAWDEHEVPFDFARYTSYGIQHVITKNGFKVVELRKTTTYLLAVSQMMIAYLVQYVLPKDRIFGRLSQLVVVFPITAISLLLNSLLPKRFEYFSNIVVKCEKVLT